MANLADTFARPGCGIRYTELVGAEPAVVFLHGAGADHIMFEHQAHAVAAAGHRAVLLDLRGHGMSRPNTQPMSAQILCDDTEALIDTLELQRPVLVGHSLGGNLAQELVRRAPGRYSGLVVMDSTWNTGPLSAWERLGLRLAEPGLQAIPAKALPRVMAKASATTSTARRDAVRAFSQLTKREFLDVWSAVTSFVRPEPAYRTPVPLMLIRGAADKTGNISRAMPAWAVAEGIVEHVFPDAGHLVSQDAPDAVSRAIVEFLGSLADSADRQH